MDCTNCESKLFLNKIEADPAIERLAAIGYGPGDISLIVDEKSSKPGFEGIGIGGATGGLLGALAAVAGSTLAIVGTGGAAAPVVVGPLVSALAGLTVGAVGGGVVGGLLGLAEHSEDWHEIVADGGVVVTVSLKTPADRERVRAALG